MTSQHTSAILAKYPSAISFLTDEVAQPYNRLVCQPEPGVLLVEPLKVATPVAPIPDYIDMVCFVTGLTPEQVSVSASTYLGTTNVDTWVRIEDCQTATFARGTCAIQSGMLLYSIPVTELTELYQLRQ